MIRFGVVGTNWITDRLIDGASHDEDFQLTAVYSRTHEKAAEFAAKYGVTTTFTNLEDMAKSDKIDAVYLASPNSFHAEQAITFMNNGKHVLCEKPLASNTKELEAMFKSAKQNNVVLMEAMKTTLLPNFNSIKQSLHKIGKIRRYVASYCQYSSRYDAYKEGTVLNAFKPEFSNGSLMDLGVYCIYPMVVLFGEPTDLKAQSIMLESGVDGQGSILLKYNDMEASIMYSKISNSYLPSEIQGEKGSMFIDKISAPEHVEIRFKDGTTEVINQTQDKPFMYYEVKEFIDLIKTQKQASTINSYENSKITMGILDKVRNEIGLIYPADQS
jgi:scyllo-inositol 2-dehydrogenase (NADP+)